IVRSARACVSVRSRCSRKYAERRPMVRPRAESGTCATKRRSPAETPESLIRSVSASERTRMRIASITAVSPSMPTVAGALRRPHLLHACREVARLDPLRGRREALQGLGDASRCAIGEKRDDSNERDAEDDEDRDEGPLGPLDPRGRNEHREKPGVLPLRAKDS